ncbi:MAG TPA: helix-turn-helix transcriptional regulator [Vicinamibacteria bacterium]|nr:helix-turn-helix transcriptional regulator [Vicinamibacteria bacterium]
MKAEPRPLTAAEFEVLLALADGDKHGYAILKAVGSGGSLSLGPATLYTIVRRFLDQGWIAETAQRPQPALDDERRRYYRLTPAGRAAARGEAQRLESVLASAGARGLLRRPRRA